MITLLINVPKQKSSLYQTSFGGLPVKNVGSGFDWPKCEACKTEMQYQGKIKTDLGSELIFICNGNPGMCNEWDADSGGNKVIIIVGEKLEFARPPSRELALRPIEHGAVVKTIEDSDNYDEARQRFAKENKVSPREVLGQIFGEPSWLQGDETPECDTCGKRMRFVSQLEQGPDWQTEMKFGGGCGYLFDCPACNSGKFLWQ